MQTYITTNFSNKPYLVDPGQHGCSVKEVMNTSNQLPYPGLVSDSKMTRGTQITKKNTHTQLANICYNKRSQLHYSVHTHTHTHTHTHRAAAHITHLAS